MKNWNEIRQSESEEIILTFEMIESGRNKFGKINNDQKYWLGINSLTNKKEEELIGTKIKKSYYDQFLYYRTEYNTIRDKAQEYMVGKIIDINHINHL